MFDIQYGVYLDEFTSQIDPLKPIQDIKALHFNDMLRVTGINRYPLQRIVLPPMCSLATHPRVNVAMFTR